jgi:WD40 domain-containing protein
MITPNAVASPTVKNEIDYAVMKAKKIIAIHLIRTVLTAGLELLIGTKQAILRWQLDEDSYARKLARALEAYADLALTAGAQRWWDGLMHGAAQARSATGRELTRLQYGGGVSAVAFGPDGPRLAVGGSGEDKLVRVWDVASGQELARLARGRDGGVESVAFSPDGSRLATGGTDKLARVWDLAPRRAPGLHQAQRVHQLRRVHDVKSASRIPR